MPSPIDSKLTIHNFLGPRPNFYPRSSSSESSRLIYPESTAPPYGPTQSFYTVRPPSTDSPSQVTTDDDPPLKTEQSITISIPESISTITAQPEYTESQLLYTQRSVHPRENSKTPALLSEETAVEPIKTLPPKGPFEPCPAVFIKYDNLEVMSEPDSKFCRKAKNASKNVLSNVSGCLAPGRLAALMGPSGAGKSTLLRALSLRTPEKLMRGDVKYNGVRPTVLEASSVSSFIYQSECFLTNLTVQEHMDFQSLLRGGDLTTAERDRRKNLLIDQMGLRKCADSPIGGAMKKGISGGEQKRLNISSEILTSPSVIFADEPTTSLDSGLALTIVQRMRTLADCGRTVVCTIHQPSSRIFSSFDDVILLSYGRQLYGGERLGVVGWMEKHGFDIPAFGNPADIIVNWANLPWESLVEKKSLESARLAELWEVEGGQFLKDWIERGGREAFIEKVRLRAESVWAHSSLHGLEYDPVSVLMNVKRKTSKGGSSKASSFATPSPPMGSKINIQSDDEESMIKEEDVKAEIIKSLAEDERRRAAKVVTILEPSIVKKAEIVDDELGSSWPSGPSTEFKQRAMQNRKVRREGGRQIHSVYDPEAQIELALSFIPPESLKLIEDGELIDYSLPSRLAYHLKLEREFQRCNSVICDPQIMKNSKNVRLSGFKQFIPLLYRSALSNSRDPILAVARAGQTFIIGLILGFLFFQLDWTEYSSRSRMGVCFSIVLNQGMQGCYQMASTFSNELDYIQREFNSNILSPTSYVLSKMIADLPLQVLFPIVFNTIIYWTSNINPSVSVFFITCGLLVLSSSAALAMGYMAAAGTTSVDGAVIVANLLMLPMQLFSGYQVQISQIPKWIAWFQYLSFYRYGYGSYVVSVFTPNDEVSLADGTVIPADEYLESQIGLEHSELLMDILGVVALMIGFRIIAIIFFGIILHVRKDKT